MRFLVPLLQGSPLHFAWTVLGFVVVLTVLVFVHEFGHYWIARRNGVKVEVFSIGFGPELFGWCDRAGTRWKISALPIGGYVKMFGDADPTSGLPLVGSAPLSAADREVSFHCKRLGQRAAIVAGGPLANFLFAIVALALLFMTIGQPQTPPATIVGVIPGSAAAAAGFLPGDKIVRIDGHAIARFDDVMQRVQFDSDNAPMTVEVQRAGKPVTLHVTPGVIPDPDPHASQQIGLGIKGGPVQYVRRSPPEAVVRAVTETWNLSATTLHAVAQMAMGRRSTKELGGPLKIAQISGEVIQLGIGPLLSFMALLSINLGLINLFPVPVLDGGHLLFYAAEAIRGKPLGQRAQEYGFRVGLALVLTLMVFATWNDVFH